MYIYIYYNYIYVCVYLFRSKVESKTFTWVKFSWDQMLVPRTCQLNCLQASLCLV